jgi:hypothetical protein
MRSSITRFTIAVGPVYAMLAGRTATEATDMINLRCTKKLQQHLGVKPTGQERPPTSALGDWLANVVQIDRGPSFILITNEHTLLSVVLPLDADVLVDFRRRAIALLRRLGLPAEVVQRETFHLQQIAVEKTNSRRVLGSMIDASDLVASALDDDTPLEEIEDRLARWLYSMIGYRYPVELAFELLGLEVPEAERPRALPSPAAIDDGERDDDIDDDSDDGERDDDAGATSAFLLRKPIYELQVSLRWITPRIWRRVRVSGNLSLAALHDVLQLSMGWEDCHLHLFALPDGRRFEPKDVEPDPEAGDERRVKLRKIAPEVGSSIVYSYDFGDGWEHDIVVEAILDPRSAGRTPTCVDGARACPPEDVGGPPGYERYVAALANPRHPEHRELLQWRGAYDPDVLDRAAINRRLRSRFPTG